MLRHLVVIVNLVRVNIVDQESVEGLTVMWV